MTDFLVWRALLILTSLFGMTVSVRANPPKDEKALAEDFRAMAKREASAYTIRLDGSDRPMTLRPEPVLKWSNPVVGTVFGEVFIWTHDGRPEVVASIYNCYENTKGDLIDGAMFVFVLGTDPEAFLLIEARRPQIGVPEWRFGAARMNSIHLRINHSGRKVWNAPEIPWARVWDATEPYTFFRYEEAAAKP
jgi:hypothetical protein